MCAACGRGVQESALWSELLCYKRRKIAIALAMTFPAACCLRGFEVARLEALFLPGRAEEHPSMIVINFNGLAWVLRILTQIQPSDIPSALNEGVFVELASTALRCAGKRKKRKTSRSFLPSATEKGFSRTRKIINWQFFDANRRMM